jgi:hypothetical protein
VRQADINQGHGMIRRLFTVASGLSLLLSVGVFALWVRSYWVGDGINKDSTIDVLEITSRGGELMYYRQTDPPLLPLFVAGPPAPWSYTSSHTLPRPDAGTETWFNRRGAAVEWREKVPAMVFSTTPMFETVTRIVLPHWLVVIPFAILPTMYAAGWLRRRARKRCRREPRCPSCDYDLRASSDRCPECGTAIASNRPAVPR